MPLEIPVGERSVVLETGKLAKQAGGSVTAQLGDTVLLSTATRSSNPRPGATFLPLSVDIEERMTAAGKMHTTTHRPNELRAGSNLGKSR